MIIRLTISRIYSGIMLMSPHFVLCNKVSRQLKNCGFNAQRFLGNGSCFQFHKSRFKNVPGPGDISMRGATE
jgi:hypothetical protein